MLPFSHHHKHTLFISILSLFVLIIGLSLAFFFDQLRKEPTQVACTQEARMCPNGSFVSRTGPHCEFSPCPKDTLPAYPGISEEPFQAPTPATPPKTETKKQPSPAKEGVICTQEVRLCSDGSFVARTGPKCQFAPCPDGLELDVDR